MAQTLGPQCAAFVPPPVAIGFYTLLGGGLSFVAAFIGFETVYAIDPNVDDVVALRVILGSGGVGYILGASAVGALAANGVGGSPSRVGLVTLGFATATVVVAGGVFAFSDNAGATAIAVVSGAAVTSIAAGIAHATAPGPLE